MLKKLAIQNHSFSIAAVIMFAVLASFAESVVEPVEFIQTDGYAYIDTGIPGNPKKIRQRARFQFLAKATSRAYYMGSYGGVSHTDCSVSCDASQMYVDYSSGTSSGYTYTSYAANTHYELVLREGYALRNDSATAKGGAPYNNKGYNWNSLKNVDIPTLWLGNAQLADGSPRTTPGDVPPIRWYEYVAYDDQTGEEYIHLKPAKRIDGETVTFGMMDKVHGGFYASAVEGHPIIGPEEVAFVPGTTYANNALIVIPSGTEVVADNADTAKIRELGGIRFEDETSTLTISNLTTEQTFRTMLFGRGKFRDILGKAETSLRLAMDNRDFGGIFDISNAQVFVNGDHVFGTTNRVYVINTSGTHHFLGDGGVVFENEFHFGGLGGSRLQPNGRFTFKGPFIFERNRSGDFHGYGTEESGSGLYLVGFVTNTLPELGGQITQSHYLRFHPTNECYLGKLRIKTTGHTRYGGRIHTTTSYGIVQNPQDYGNIGPSGGSTVSFVAGCDNVFDDDVIFLFGHGYTSNATPGGKMDLNGTNQRVGRLITGVGNPGQDQAAPPQATGLQITSETPGSLTIRNTTVLGHSPYNGYHPNLFPGRINGAASVILDTEPSLSAGGFKVGCAGSNTSGGLYARRGTITILATATFTNLTELVASGEGRLDVNTGAIGGDDFRVVLTNSTLTAGKVPLTIAENCVLTARTAIVTRSGADRWLAAGDYTAANLPDHVGGGGTLKVLEYGGPKGLVFIIR